MGRSKSVRELGNLGRASVAETQRSARRKRLDDQMKTSTLQPGMRADRCAARTFQCDQSAALGGDTDRGRLTAQGLDPRQIAIRLSGLDGQSTLPRGRVWWAG